MKYRRLYGNAVNFFADLGLTCSSADTMSYGQFAFETVPFYNYLRLKSKNRKINFRLFFLSKR